MKNHMKMKVVTDGDGRCNEGMRIDLPDNGNWCKTEIAM